MISQISEADGCIYVATSLTYFNTNILKQRGLI